MKHPTLARHRQRRAHRPHLGRPLAGRLERGRHRPTTAHTRPASGPRTARPSLNHRLQHLFWWRQKFNRYTYSCRPEFSNVSGNASAIRLAKPRPLLLRWSLRYGTAATRPPKRNWATSIKKWNGCWPPISSRPLTISAITVRQGRGPRAGRWRLPAWSALRQFSLLLPEQNSEQTAVLDSTDAPIAKRNPPVPRPHRPKYARCRNRFAGAAFSQRYHKLRFA